MLSQQDQCILRAKWLQFSYRWKRFSLNVFLQSVGFLLLLLIFWFLAYQLVSHLCGALYSIKVVGPIVLQRVLSFGFLAAFIVVTIGQMLTSLSSLYRGAKLSIIVTSPYPLPRLFRYQTLESLITGGWVSGIFCLPILWAYGHELNAAWWYYPVCMLGLLGLLANAGLLGILIMLVIAKSIIGRPRRMAIGILGLLCLFGCFVVYMSSLSRVFFSHVDMAKVGEALANLRMSSTPYLPNNWLAELMFAAQQQDLYSVGLYLLLFFSSTMLLWYITLEMGHRFYTDAWLWAQERIAILRTPRVRGSVRKRNLWLQRIFPSRIGSIIHKEITVFLRDFSQWGQLVMILLLILFYVSHVSNIRSMQENEVVLNQMAFFNIVLLGFLQATLALRYTFPSISLEGKASWALFSSSMGIREFYFTKYFLHASILLLFGGSITWALNSALGIDPILHRLCMLVLVLLSFGLASCTLGLGAIFHNFEAKTVSDVTSDTGALVAMIFTLLYFAGTMYLSARFALNYYFGLPFFQQFDRQPILYLDTAGFFALQYLALALPTSLGIQKLRKTEY